MFELKLDVPRDEAIVNVNTTHHRGFTPEELAVQCVSKIISVADTAPPSVQDQARAFQNNLESLVTSYMRQAVLSDRTTVYNTVKNAGHPALAEILRRL
jgi:hypothetical protein|tara:strand:+ start:714 stop:1010 length:297 start_codon:yes stop_codon:yes gene_type:complete